jgi:hypothetical protein
MMRWAHCRSSKLKFELEGFSKLKFELDIFSEVEV